MIRKTIKTIYYLLAVLSVCILMHITYAWSINLNDKPPSETSLEFQEAFNSIQNKPIDNNGYETFLSFGKNEIIEIFQSEEFLEFRNSCNKADSCAQLILQQENFSFNSLLAQNSSLLEQYEKLISHTAYSDIDYLKNDGTAPFSEVQWSQKLYLINLLNPENELPAAAVRHALDKDLRFWRLALSESVTFISKILAVSALNNHFQFTNALYRNLPPEVIEEVLPESLFTPLSKEELSLDRVMIGEWHYMNSFFSEKTNIENNEFSFSINRLIRFNIFQPQDTRNILAEHTASYMAHFDRPIEEFPQVKSNPPAIDAGDDLWSLFLDPYNPGGKMMASLALPAYENYFLQVGDVEVARRALVLISQMRSQGISPHEASAYIAQTDIKHPYNGENFKWDPEQQSLMLFALESESDRLNRYAY